MQQGCHTFEVKIERFTSKPPKHNQQDEEWSVSEQTSKGTIEALV